MVNVYLLGHGFLWSSEENFQLSVELCTYVSAGMMLDGRGLADLIDNGRYTVIDEATNIVSYPMGTMAQEHLLCSDMSTMRDINTTQKWLNRDQDAWIEKEGWGRLTRLTEDSYVYVTTYNRLTRLSDIQHLIGEYMEFWQLGQVPYMLHWAACRSFVEGNTDLEIIEACTSGLAQPQSLMHADQVQDQ